MPIVRSGFTVVTEGDSFLHRSEVCPNGPELASPQRFRVMNFMFPVKKPAILPAGFGQAVRRSGPSDRRL
jgi:hypothetical protein